MWFSSSWDKVKYLSSYQKMWQNQAGLQPRGSLARHFLGKKRSSCKWNVAKSCRKQGKTTSNPEKKRQSQLLCLLSGPFSVTVEVILWLRWAPRRVAACPEQRSRRIYHWTACQGDYWIKITIWHFFFSVLAQWTEGKLLQPSVPSSTLLIASLAPLQPVREKSFCQNITQCTDFFSL